MEFFLRPDIILIFTNYFKSFIMGRGDKKTAKGKRFKGSFGKSRPVTKSPAKKTAAKKAAAAK
jgi:30S ribosomal protein S31